MLEFAWEPTRRSSPHLPVKVSDELDGLVVRMPEKQIQPEPAGGLTVRLRALEASRADQAAAPAGRRLLIGANA